MNENLILSKSNSWKMFDAISPRYDLLNHLLSFGLDIFWRKELVRFLPDRKGQKVLDLATGTAGVLLALFKNTSKVQSAFGIDLADKMLEVGRGKLQKKKLEYRATLEHGDARQIPFDENTFDAVTIAFGIRNMEDHPKVLKQMHRVLNTGGRALILEFSLPERKILKNLHLFYLRNVVPFVGAIFSGHYKAYRYLNQTIESFPYGDDFCALMRAAGFENVRANPLLFGVAAIYQGDKM